MGWRCRGQAPCVIASTSGGPPKQCSSESSGVMASIHGRWGRIAAMTMGRSSWSWNRARSLRMCRCETGRSSQRMNRPRPAGECGVAWPASAMRSARNSASGGGDLRVVQDDWRPGPQPAGGPLEDRPGSIGGGRRVQLAADDASAGSLTGVQPGQSARQMKFNLPRNPCESRSRGRTTCCRTGSLAAC